MKIKRLLIIISILSANSYGQSFTFEKVLQFGEAQPKDENYMLYRVTDIVTDGEGNIIILEAGNKRIQVFDKKGIYLKTIGKPGQGPGEFISPISIAYKEPNQLLVLDRKLRRLSLFKNNGDFLRSFLCEDIMPAQVCISTDGDIFISRFGFVGNGGLIYQFTNAGELVQKFCDPIQSSEAQNALATGNSGHLVYNPQKQLLYYSLHYPYRIFQYGSSLQEIAVFQREVEGIEPPVEGARINGRMIGAKSNGGIRGSFLLKQGVLLQMIKYKDKSEHFDFWSETGEFLETMEKSVPGKLLHVDKDSNLYTYQTEPHPMITKYMTVFNSKVEK